MFPPDAPYEFRLLFALQGILECAKVLKGKGCADVALFVILMRRLAGEDENAGDPCVCTEGYIRIEPVSDHGKLIRFCAVFALGHFRDGAVRLADDFIRTPSGRGLDEGHDRADIGNEAAFNGAVEVRMRGDIGNARAHEIAHQRKLFIGQRLVEAQNEVLRILLRQNEARIGKFLLQGRRTRKKDVRSGRLLTKPERRSFTGGKDIVRRDIDAEARKPGDVSVAAAGRVVGQIDRTPSGFSKIGEKGECTREEAVA